MRILEFEPMDIKIFDEKEIINKCIQKCKLILKSKEETDLLKETENTINLLDKFIRIPIPYKLFKLNRLFNFTLNYIGVEITEEQYNERLGQLPPRQFKYGAYSGFIVPECITDNIYEHLIWKDSVCYCVLMPSNMNMN